MAARPPAFTQGEVVARAKRTDRAEARRRHRAQYLRDTEVVDESASEAVTAGPVASDPRARTAARGRGRTPDALAVQRPQPAGGMRNAFRAAFRPLNLAEDLRLLPRLLRHRAFLVPVLLSAVTAIALVAFQGRELISQFAATYFLAPPPIGGLFLAGFLAPRASYLIGALVGVMSTIFLGMAASTLSGVATGPDGSAVVDPVQVVISGLVISPLSGLFFSAAAAWYRRFLYLASPARQMPPRRPPAARGKPARGR
jgi:hypothetical protein